jgi:P27 family predicted phage terminase small subunit
MSQLLRCGLMTEIDRAALAGYCQAYGRWVQAERALARMGEKDLLTGALMIKTSNGNAIQNPLVGTANKAMELMLRAASEFGMTPSAR